MVTNAVNFGKPVYKLPGAQNEPSAGDAKIVEAHEPLEKLVAKFIANAKEQSFESTVDEATRIAQIYFSRKLINVKTSIDSRRTLSCIDFPRTGRWSRSTDGFERQVLLRVGPGLVLSHDQQPLQSRCETASEDGASSSAAETNHRLTSASPLRS